MDKKRKIIIAVTVAVVAVISFLLIPTIRWNARQVSIDSMSLPVEKHIANLTLKDKYYTKKVRTKTKSFYQQNDYQTKWLTTKGPNKNYEAFIESITSSAQYGLNPDHYELNAIEDEVKSLYRNNNRTAEEIGDLDVRITCSFFLLTTHLIEGRIRTVGYGDFIWKKNVPKENDIHLLLQHESGKLSTLITQLHPRHEQYEKLKEALAFYRQFEPSRTHVVLTSGKSNVIKPGMKSKAIPEIRKRLLLTDLKAYEVKDSLFYDDTLSNAVKAFQARHGLIADGIISEATLRYINQPFKDKADLIELNLERMRWKPREYGKEYISINIPEYMMRVVQNGKTEFEMRVVLGEEFNPTPVFSDSLEYIVFSPTWNVPPGIMEKEVLTNLQQNPNHYNPELFKLLHKGKEINPEDVDWNSKEIDIRQYQLVQRPGPENSLGLVKFIMPNNMHIYLHDTPADKLFNKNKRAFSHGCIRVEDPLKLSAHLLRNQSKWNKKSIEEAMHQEEPINVPLKKKVAVEIEYLTVWVDENGIVQFREDIYGHDKQQLKKLNRLL